MPDVFISYVEEDRVLALGLSEGLEAAGFTTWCYELHSVPGPSYLMQTGQGHPRLPRVPRLALA